MDNWPKYIVKVQIKIKTILLCLFSVCFLLTYVTIICIRGIRCQAAVMLVPHGRLLTKIALSGVDSRVVVWIREFLLGRT